MTATLSATEIVQSVFEAFGRGDIAYILDRISADCRWVAPGKAIPNAGVYSGPAGAAEFFQRLAASENVTRFEPREYFVNGDAVVALGYEECTIVSNGKKAATEWAMLFRVRDGKIAEWRAYYDTEEYRNAHSA